MNHNRPMNFRDVAKQIRAMGLDVSKDDGEYRVAPRLRDKDKAERRAYYTNDLADLLGTATVMAGFNGFRPEQVHAGLTTPACK